MNPIVRNVLAVLLGLVVTMLVNGGLIALSASVIPPPAGVDPNNMESLKANIHLFHAKHFVFPYMAHALGSLLGAFVAAKLAATRKMIFALVIGGIHLIGGIMAATMIPAPTWFIASDLILSYLPMAWIGGRLARG